MSEQQYNVPLKADEEGGISETASLAESILHYRRENGRTYHSYKDGSRSF